MINVTGSLVALGRFASLYALRAAYTMRFAPQGKDVDRAYMRERETDDVVLVWSADRAHRRAGRYNFFFARTSFRIAIVVVCTKYNESQRRTRGLRRQHHKKLI